MPLTLVKYDLSATLAIINANIKTMNPNQPTAQALAIAGNRIIKVGSNQDIEPFIGENTVSCTLKTKLFCRDLIDTHIHVADYGRCLMWLDLTSAKSIAELQTIIKEKAQTDARWQMDHRARLERNPLPRRTSAQP